MGTNGWFAAERTTPSSLREWRTALGVTQAQLAEWWGYNRATINNWETGKTRIPYFVDLIDWKKMTEMAVAEAQHLK